MPLITRDGFDFAFDPGACERCGAQCCKGEAGHIWVTPDEISAIAQHLGLEVHVFVQDYLVKAGGRLSVKEVRVKGSLECALLDRKGRRCTVYPVRPGQCRTYPFWDCFKGNAAAAQAECPGVQPLKATCRQDAPLSSARKALVRSCARRPGGLDQARHAGSASGEGTARAETVLDDPIINQAGPTAGLTSSTGPTTRWVEITFRLPSLWVEALTPLLEDLGLTGVWIEEPDRSPRTVVRAYLLEKRWCADLKARLEAHLKQLARYLPAPCGPVVEQRLIEDQDWAAAWLPFFEPIQIGPVWIRPSAKPVRLSNGEQELILDPGQAFGTGHHETTRLCLEAILRLRLRLNDDAAILDLGTGSGILAMLAAALGFNRITAIDTDAVAVETASKNIRLNAMDPLIRVSGTRLERLPGRFDLILANLTASALRHLSDGIIIHLTPGGWLVASGVLIEQADRINAHFLSKGLEPVERRQAREWACLILRAPAALH